MFEDIYFLTKNGRPDAEKNHDYNASCHYMLRNMKTEGVIMKTYHVDPKDPVFDKYFHEKMDRTFFQKDLAPFVKYSINKKKRWETDGSFETLTDLQKSYKDMDVVVNDRVWLQSSPYWCFISHENYFHNFFLQFPISKTAQLDTDNNYTCLTSGSVYGQPYKSLLPENRSHKKINNKDGLETKNFEKPKVAYHILTPPKNYERLRNEDFRPGSCHNGCCNVLSHSRRDEKLKETKLSIRYEDFRNLDEEVDLIEDNIDPHDDDSAAPKKYYNLMDHVVDGTVHTNGDSSNCSSSWSIVQLD